jgi:hypothetical protein
LIELQKLWKVFPFEFKEHSDGTDFTQVQDIEENSLLTNNSLENELNNILKTAAVETTEKTNYGKLAQEFTLFRTTATWTEHLRRLHNAFSTIKPTSINAEKTFSVSANLFS